MLLTLLVLSILPEHILFSGSNHILFLNNSQYSLIIAQRSTNNTIVCRGSSIYNLTFGENTFNNTLYNCTIYGVISSLHNAENNVINASGNYSFSFADNSSNVGIGYYLHVIVYDKNESDYGVARFVEILPRKIVEENPGLISMYVPMSRVIATANQFNYTLPRFGIQLNASINGSAYFPIEAKQIYKNRIINFNPYEYYTPYSGYDQVVQYYFNITKNILYKPAYIQPLFPFADIFPANKPVLLRFLIEFYNKSSNQFLIMSAPQSWPANVVAKYYNVSNGVFTYNAGFEKPGAYGFDTILNTPYDHENSTSPFYSVGISYCSPWGAAINESGYYPFVYPYLHSYYVFWITNSSCNFGPIISGSNIIINCLGAAVNENLTDFVISDAKNVTIENCKLYGNGINASNSEVKLINITFIAKNYSNIAVSLHNSNLTISNVSFEGYNYINVISGNLSIMGMENYGHLQTTVQNVSPATYTSSTTMPLRPYALVLFIALFAFGIIVSIIVFIFATLFLFD